jgi:predicted amidohydrolase
MRLVLCQFAPVLGNIEKNVVRIERVVARTDGDLFVFPELFMTGYAIRDRVSHLAMAEGSPFIGRLAKLAGDTGKGLLVGLPMKDEALRGVVRNSALFVQADGELRYRHKTYMPNFGPFEELTYFKQGEIEEVVPWHAPWGRLGVIICYEIFFPELCARLARLGADLIVCISAGPFTSKESFERVIPARAVENTVYFAYCNRVGVDLGMVFHGGSKVVDPRGKSIAESPLFDEQTLACDVDLHTVRFARRARPTLRDSPSP